MLTFFRMTVAGLLAAYLIAAAPLMAQARILQNLDNETVGLLANFLASETPNFRERALNTREYRQANEFDKPQVLERIEARMRSEYEGFADIDGIKLRVSTKIGQYDAAAGVYRIDLFSPGGYFPFGRYGLTLDNASDFHEWELPVAEARRIRELSPFGNMVAEIVLRPFGVAPDDQNQVRTQIIDLKLFEQRSGRLVHTKVVPPAEYRNIQVASNTGPSMLQAEKVSLAGISIGMGVEDAKAVLEGAGYRISQDAGNGSVFFTTAGKDVPYLGQLTTDERLIPGSLAYGLNLDCRDDDQIQSCGRLRYDQEAKTVVNMALLQIAVGTSKQDIVTALFQKYGPATDRFDTSLWRRHLADQYVWGGFVEGRDVPATDFTPISGPKHWQVEAFLMEPDTRRKAVIVQINKVGGSSAVTGAGGVKF